MVILVFYMDKMHFKINNQPISISILTFNTALVYYRYIKYTSSILDTTGGLHAYE